MRLVVIITACASGLLLAYSGLALPAAAMFGVAAMVVIFGYGP